MMKGIRIDYLGKVLLIENEKDGERVLVVGDLHLGYESELEGKGISFGRKMYEEIIEEFELIFKKIGRKINKIILLGDLKHGFSRANSQEWEEVRKLIQYFNGNLEERGEVIVLKGNHDNYLENIIGKSIKEIIGIKIEVKESYLWKGICFVHGDKDWKEIWSKETELVVCGHVHPVVNLEEGAKRERYKCYLEGEIKKGIKKKKIIVIPSFLENERGVDVKEITRPWPWKIEISKFEVKVVGEKLEVLNFGKVGKLK